MARAGPRKVRAYSLEFKLTAVRLSQQPGMQVQAVAAALDIHPFMHPECLAGERDRPDSSVPRHEAELHVDSLAK